MQHVKPGDGGYRTVLKTVAGRGVLDCVRDILRGQRPRLRHPRDGALPNHADYDCRMGEAAKRAARPAAVGESRAPRRADSPSDAVPGDETVQEERMQR
jgi:hypothetical protein